MDKLKLGFSTGTEDISIYLEDLESLGFLLAIIIFFICILIITFPAYLMLSHGIKKMADNRNIQRSWCAWLPGVNTYLLGKLASDDSEDNKGSRGKTFFIITIFAIVLSLIPFTALNLIVMSVYFIYFYYIIFNILKKYTQSAVMHLILSIIVPYYLPILVFIKRKEKPNNQVLNSQD